MISLLIFLVLLCMLLLMVHVFIPGLLMGVFVMALWVVGGISAIIFLFVFFNYIKFVFGEKAIGKTLKLTAVVAGVSVVALYAAYVFAN